MSEPLDPTYLDTLAGETMFDPQSLEKVFRLLDLIRGMNELPSLRTSFALKGGTAIQCICFDLSRLSVDIDLNYIGSMAKNDMLIDKERCHDTFSALFSDRGYDMKFVPRGYITGQYHLRYRNSRDVPDRIKVDLNYIERMAVYPIITRRMDHPFGILGDISVLSYRDEELFASKIRAMLSRGSPRDMYDCHIIERNRDRFDMDVLRKLVLFYLCLSNLDTREVVDRTKLDMDPSRLNTNLLPMLRKDRRDMDLERMMNDVNSLIERVFDLTPDEREFLDGFYERKVFDPALLFGTPDMNHLKDHPMLLWRLQQLRKTNV